MNDFQKGKIIAFANDKLLLDTVYSVLLDSFLKERPNQDIHILAASRLAVDYLKQGWKELEGYATKSKDIVDKSGNVGL